MGPWFLDTQVGIAAVDKYSMGERWRKIDAVIVFRRGLGGHRSAGQPRLEGGLTREVKKCKV